MDQAVLFERDRAEKVDDWESLVGRLGRSPFSGSTFPGPTSMRSTIWRSPLELTEESRGRLAADDDGPYFGDGDYLHVRAYAPSAKVAPTSAQSTVSSPSTGS